MPKRKLSNADRVEIKELFEQSISIRALATMYGVQRDTIRMIVYPEVAEQRRKAMRERYYKLKEGK